MMEKIFEWFRNQSWIPAWLRESNREKHFLLAIPCGFLLTMLFVLGIASGMEFKDTQYSGSWSSWDWLDWTATVLGGLLGAGLRWIIIGIILLCI